MKTGRAWAASVVIIKCASQDSVERDCHQNCLIWFEFSTMVHLKRVFFLFALREFSF